MQHGNALGSVDPLGQGGSATYDFRNSKPLQETDALGHSTTHIYDASGINLLSTTDALGHTSAINSYWWGLPTSVSDALGHTSTMSYDGDGNVVQATDANGNSSTATYNRAGWKLTSTDALGNLTTSAYDAWGRVAAVTDPNRTTVSSQYDNNGNVLQVSLRHASALKTGGGPLGAFADDSGLHSDTTSGSSSVLYTTNTPDLSGVAAGNLAPGAIYQSARQGDFNYWLGGFTPGRAYTVRLHICDMWDASSGQRCFDVQLNGQTVLSTFDPTHTLGFQKAGILEYSATADGSGHISVYFYNRWGGALINALEIVPASADRVLVTNTYDIDNRLLTTAKANGDKITYYYDHPPDPNDTSTANIRRGRLAAKVDGNGNILAYGYTARGELKALYYPDSSQELFTYDENGDLYQHTKRDRSVTTYAYDNDSRPITTTYPAGSNTASVTQDYYANGLGWHMYDGTGTTTWTYDAANRLTQMSAPGSAVTSAYDDDNRLTSKSVSNVGTWTSQYDNGGRLTQQGTPQGSVSYNYDNANRLTRLTKGNGMLTDYAYDPDGRTTEIWWHRLCRSGGVSDGRRHGVDATGEPVLRSHHWAVPHA